MDGMKVLFLAYPRIGLNRGGLQVQIEETAKGLAQLGIEVIRYDPWQNQIPEVDICHVFSIDGALVHHVVRAVSLGIPVVVSPVLNLFASRPMFTMMKRQLSSLPGLYSDLRRAGNMLNAATKIVALNEDERDLLMKVFNVAAAKCCVIPNGISMAFRDGDARIFEQAYGVTQFVLNVASIEPRKNQLSLIRAMKRLPYTLVLVGKASHEHEAYLDECKAEAGDNVKFIGALKHDDPMLAACYKAAKLFVMPSFSEVMPLTLYEAAVAGCRLLVSDQVPVADPLVPFISRCSPKNTDTLSHRIDVEMREGKTEAIRQALTAMPTWSGVCAELRRIYLEVCTPISPVEQTCRSVSGNGG